MFAGRRTIVPGVARTGTRNRERERAFEHDNEHLEGRRVLRESLTGIERQERQVTSRRLRQDAACDSLWSGSRTPDHAFSHRAVRVAVTRATGLAFYRTSKYDAALSFVSLRISPTARRSAAESLAYFGAFSRPDRTSLSRR